MVNNETKLSFSVNRFTRAFEDDEVTLDIDDSPEESPTGQFIGGFGLQ